MCNFNDNVKINIKVKEGRKEIVVDRCMVDLIISLNQKGLHTLNSCCGHNKSGAWIVFKEENSRLLHGNLAEVYDKTTYDIFKKGKSYEELNPQTGEDHINYTIKDLEEIINNRIQNNDDKQDILNSINKVKELVKNHYMNY